MQLWSVVQIALTIFIVTGAFVSASPPTNILQLADADALARIRIDSFVYAVMVTCRTTASEQAKRHAPALSEKLTAIGVTLLHVNAFGNEFERAFAGTYAEAPLPLLLIFDKAGSPARPVLISSAFSSADQWYDLVFRRVADLDQDSRGVRIKRHVGNDEL